MDNLKYYNSGVAYDFDMFMPKTRESKENNIIKLPQTQKKVRQRRKIVIKSLSGTVYAVMISAFILAALCGNIFLRLEINEVNSQINDMKREINTLDSEKTSLEVEFERRISYSNIEIEAAQLGMQKMDKNQVKYIRVNDKDTAKSNKGTFVGESK